MILEYSRDHIFPSFLGGKKEITCCKKCNDVFGHTFEAEAARYLQRLHIFISSWGVPLRSVDPTWREAYIHEEKPLDLSVGTTGVRVTLSHPIIKRDEKGELISAEFESKQQAEEFLRRMIDKGKATEARIEEVPAVKPSLAGLQMDLQIGPAVRRTALKMCVALASCLPDSPQEDMSEGLNVLLADPSSKPLNTLVAFAIYEAIDSRRPPLAHVIYVERGRERFYGLVQFFGVIQLYCALGKPNQNATDAALLGVLDPVTGHEGFPEVSSLGIPDPPLWFQKEEYAALMAGWAEKFRQEAVKRGATHPPTLKWDVLAFS